MSNEIAAPRVNELKPVRELQPLVKDLFPSAGALEWEIRQRKQEYVEGGALYLICGRLVAHPESFRRVALAIGAKRAAAGRR